MKLLIKRVRTGGTLRRRNKSIWMRARMIILLRQNRRRRRRRSIPFAATAAAVRHPCLLFLVYTVVREIHYLSLSLSLTLS